MEVRVLGPLQVLHEGRDVTPTGRLQRAVFVRLLVDANHAVSAGRLAEDVFGEGQDLKNPTAALQIHVSRLRKALTGDADASHDLILHQRPGYSLRLGRDELDAWRFEHLVAEATVALDEARAEVAVATLRMALELWRGSALADFAFASYAQPVIGRLEELRLAAVEKLCEARLSLDATPELVAELQALVSEHPLRERLWGQLMRALYRSGRQSEALRAYQDLRRLLDDEVGLAPGPELQALEQAVLRQDRSLDTHPEAAQEAAPTGPHHPPPLPAALTRFVGRATARAELVSALTQARLVTLTGMAGVGKTRLALEVASDVAPSMPDGVWFVALASLADPALVTGAVASTLGVKEEPGLSPAQALVGAIGDRHLLLVLDNCEHLLQGCAELVLYLLEHCPHLRVLSTSQEALGLPGEAAWPLPPLSVPPADVEMSAEEMADHESVQLFCDRAGLVRPDFVLDGANAAAVATICRRLDGLPLAIELAAAGVAQLAVDDIAQLLDDRFNLLTGGSRWVATRHQTLVSAVDWSHGLLSDTERVLLRRMSVFAGGATLSAVEEVCSGSPLGVSQVFSALTALVAKSMVVADTGCPQARYRLLETIRHYASDRLLEAGEHAVVAGRHATWCVGLAEWAESGLAGPEQTAWQDRLRGDLDSIRAALAWATGEHRGEIALRLSSALALFWTSTGWLEGRRWLERSLAVDADDAPLPLQAKALWATARTCLMLGDDMAAARAAFRSLAFSQSCGDVQGQARALLVIGQCALGDERFGSPHQPLEQSVRLAREAGDDWCLYLGLAVSGWAHLHRGDLNLARPLFGEVVRLARQSDNATQHTPALIGLGYIALARGDYPAAESLLNEALGSSRATNDQGAAWAVLCLLAQRAMEVGDHDAAHTMLEEALDLAARLLHPRDFHEPLILMGRLALETGDLDNARTCFGQALAVGESAGLKASHGHVGLAEVHLASGEPAEAKERLDVALALAQDKGNIVGLAEVESVLGTWARAVGALEPAAAHLHRSLAARARVGNIPGVVRGLEAMASVALARGACCDAARLFGAAEAHRVAIGFARPPAEQRSHEADLAELEEHLTSEELELAWAGGAALSVGQAVECAGTIAASAGRGGSPGVSGSPRPRRFPEAGS